MISYIIRRLLYAIPILVGVNVLTFALFFVVNTPDEDTTGTGGETPEPFGIGIADVKHRNALSGV